MVSGRKLVVERAAYFALVGQGVGFREAARRVGVGYRLTKRWRAAAPAVEPVVEPEISARLLNLDERVLIADLRRESVSVREIGRRLERPASTISRELARNQQPNGSYRPHAAHQLAVRGRARPKVGKIAADPVLRAVIQDGLEQRHSPQQITRRLRRDYPDRPEWHVTHETIYQALYVQAKGGLRREVALWLRTGRVHRRPHRKPDERQSRMATPMVMISERPAEVEDRAVPGHWEGDLIMGAHNKTAIGTLVERATRFVMLRTSPTATPQQWSATPWSPKSRLCPSSYVGHSPGTKARRALPRPVHRRHPDAGLLLRPTLTLATRIEREHQRPTPPILPQKHRPVSPLSRAPRLCGSRTQRPTPHDPRLGHPNRTHH